jgi:hypothetical protein
MGFLMGKRERQTIAESIRLRKTKLNAKDQLLQERILTQKQAIKRLQDAGNYQKTN